MTPTENATATPPSTDSSELLPPREAAELLNRLLQPPRPISETTMEVWRRDPERAQPLPYIKGFGGRVRYRRADLEHFARESLTPRLPKAVESRTAPIHERVLPASWITAAELTLADRSHGDFVINGGRRAPGIFETAEHAARVDHEIAAATAALRQLVRQTGAAAIERMAVWRVVAKHGRLEGVGVDEVVLALRDIAASFRDQLAAWKDELPAEAQTLKTVRTHRQPLRKAVHQRIADLTHERDRAVGKRNALGRGKSASGLASDLVAAGIPTELIRQVAEAAGERDIGREFDDLNARVHEITGTVTKLKGFLAAAPGDYSALEGMAEFEPLIAAERRAHDAAQE